MKLTTAPVFHFLWAVRNEEEEEKEEDEDSEVSWPQLSFPAPQFSPRSPGVFLSFRFAAKGPRKSSVSLGLPASLAVMGPRITRFHRLSLSSRLDAKGTRISWFWRGYMPSINGTHISPGTSWGLPVHLLPPRVHGSHPGLLLASLSAFLAAKGRVYCHPRDG